MVVVETWEPGVSYNAKYFKDWVHIGVTLNNNNIFTVHIFVNPILDGGGG